MGRAKSAAQRLGSRTALTTLLCLLPVALGLAISVQACGHDCTEMACTPGAEVVFSQALDDSATYVVNVAADGEPISCEVNLTESYLCPELEFFVTGSGATVTNSGARLPSAGFAGLLVRGHPRSVQVEILRADQRLGSASSTLEYQGVEVNGAGCGECRLATMTMDVSP
jgi:hypothetical protein